MLSNKGKANMQQKKVIIIGSGVAGLATSIRLAQNGYQVEVFEANNYVGGKLTVIEQDGFRFDAGPSLFTLPKLMVELLDLCGKNTLDYFSYSRLPIICRYFYEDGTIINGYSKAAKFAIEVTKKTGEPPTHVWEHLKKAANLYKITAQIFLENSLHKPRTYLNLHTLKAVAQLHKIGVLQSMNNANEKAFVMPKVRQLFNRFATYNGSNPYEAPATLNIIPHLEHNIGAYFPKGGMHSITKILYRLATESGVTFHLNQKVTQIIVADKKVRGIKVGEDKHVADYVVSNMDIVPTYQKLLPNEKHPTKTLAQPKSSSALIFYWGIAKEFPNLELHNIFFSDNYRQEFEQIFKHKTITDDPTIYIHISSKYEPTDAPKGCENWFVMINVPANYGQDWDMLIQQAKKNIINKINRILAVDISPLITTEAMLDPRSIEAKTASHLGALYGSSSNNKLAAFLRHPNFSSEIKGLYFCGGSVHPGGGVPLCLLSAKIVANLL